MLTKLMHVMVKLYFESFPPGNEQLLIILKTIKVFGLSVFLFILPVFINHIMHVKLNLLKKAVFLSISLSALSLYILKAMFKYHLVYDYFIINTFFVLLIAYCICTVVFNLKNVSDKKLKIIILTFLILAVVFFPLEILDIILGETSIQLPVSSIIINTLSIIFCFFYLASPMVKEKDRLKDQAADQSGDYFQTKYNITRREKEIIKLIKTGYSNSEISDKMLISVSTVEKHIYNIYQKLNVKNRIQLINLIQSDL